MIIDDTAFQSTSGGTKQRETSHMSPFGEADGYYAEWKPQIIMSKMPSPFTPVASSSYSCGPIS